MTPKQFVKKWMRQITGEIALMFFRLEGPGLKERLGEFLQWLETSLERMAEDSRNIEWPAPLTVNGRINPPGKKEAV